MISPWVFWGFLCWDPAEENAYGRSSGRRLNHVELNCILKSVKTFSARSTFHCCLHQVYSLKKKKEKFKIPWKLPFSFNFPPFFKDSNTLLVDRELEPISRRRGAFMHVRESIVRLLHHFLWGSGQADLCKQSAQWQITQLELAVPCGNIECVHFRQTVL